MSKPKRKAMAYFVVRREIEYEPCRDTGRFDGYDVSRAWREVMPEILRSVVPINDRCHDGDVATNTTFAHDIDKGIEAWFAAFFVAAAPATDGGPECGYGGPVVGQVMGAMDFLVRRVQESHEKMRAEIEEWERRLKADPSLCYIQTTALNPKTGEETP